MEISRRFFLGGLVAAPAVIAIDRLMPIKVVPELTREELLASAYQFECNPEWTDAAFRTRAAILYNAGHSIGKSSIISAQAAAMAAQAEFESMGSWADYNRIHSVQDFGGPQSVSEGTFQLVLPKNPLYHTSDLTPESIEAARKALMSWGSPPDYMEISIEHAKALGIDL
jgi:hypothetical protein